MSIGSNIKERRLALGMTQRELAEMVGVDQSMICQIERGSKTPTLPLGRDISEALQCHLEDILKEAS